MAQAQPMNRRMVVVGAGCLSVCAGIINGLMLVSHFHVGVSHMTGAVSALAVDVVVDNSDHLIRIGAIIIGFFIGCVMSGGIVGHKQLQPGRRYGIALMLEGVLLMISAGLFTQFSVLSAAAAACACGLQNGMASDYLGLILRTTHVTGIVTDLGVMIGRRLRGQHIDGWQTLTLSVILLGFAGGGFAGAYVGKFRPVLGLLATGMVVVSVGVAYWWHRHRLAPCPS